MTGPQPDRGGDALADALEPVAFAYPVIHRFNALGTAGVARMA